MTAWKHIKRWLPTAPLEEKEYIVDIARKDMGEDGYF